MVFQYKVYIPSIVGKEPYSPHIRNTLTGVLCFVIQFYMGCLCLYICTICMKIFFCVATFNPSLAISVDSSFRKGDVRCLLWLCSNSIMSSACLWYVMMDICIKCTLCLSCIYLPHSETRNVNTIKWGCVNGR